MGVLPRQRKERPVRVKFTVNGREQQADDVWEGESLLYVLRERMGLPGSKNACEQGECGSCTVRLDGVPVCSCLVAAGQAEGREIVTVEGLADYAEQRAQHGGCATGACGAGTSVDAAQRWQAKPAGADGQTGEQVKLSPIQRAFIDAGAVQCGFCTPGLLVAADELLERNAQPSDADIREALSGNLCRCTGYEKILDAVRLAAARGDAQTTGTGA
ncbi:oxidoreductase [Streptomyces rimosus subsp. rimosus]|nr:oxidoreductase [Streptomyces sp. NRRL WC-3701]KOT34980.1 oxidoreductase [Streptomyces rimosus subsp. rimosus]KOT58439.1 oxidoreductase [Streptomyces rimosus subsp. rimosus]KOT58505.1 oxidoreductase [Streptomyces rimosus subsp. rimosus]KOT75263.1 oxidoreductase [Streptomyces rimosus subsp. rimosus]